MEASKAKHGPGLHMQPSIYGRLLLLIFIEEYMFTSTQEDSTHSAAPSKCIHSSIKKIHMDKTGLGKQSSTSKNSTATNAHLWAHACQPETTSHWTLQAFPNMHGT
jgi:hypothetical protein